MSTSLSHSKHLNTFCWTKHFSQKKFSSHIQSSLHFGKASFVQTPLEMASRTLGSSSLLSPNKCIFSSSDSLYFLQHSSTTPNTSLLQYFDKVSDDENNDPSAPTTDPAVFSSASGILRMSSRRDGILLLHAIFCISVEPSTILQIAEETLWQTSSFSG